MKVLKKILIVTDNPDDLLSFKDLYDSLNTEIIRVGSTDEAFAVISEHELVMSIFDTDDSALDVHKILRLIQQSEKAKSLPVMFTGKSFHEQESPVEEMKECIVDYLHKPIIKNIFAARIKMYVDLYEQKKKLEFEIEKCRLYKEALKEAEKKFQEIKLKSGESDRLITTFFSNLSHEIRTPLNAVIGFSNLLADETLTGSVRIEYIKYINNSSLELINLIDNIIDIAKIEAGQLRIKKDDVNVRNILMDLYTTMKEEISNRGLDSLDLIFANNNHKENIVIKTDEFLLCQVMKNLLNNALKYTESGFIEYGYEIKNNSKILFYVKDTGTGIPEDKLNMVFDRFEQIKKCYYTNIPGTGLGLFAVKKMVELMGGKIRVESALNKGSKFYFELPGEKVEQNRIKSREQVSARLKPVYNWKDKTILIAEDEYTNFHYLNEVLKATGIKVIWAKDGNEAVKFASQENLDLILMDIKLPFLSGIDAFYKIKERKSDVPVIAQTAYAMPDEKEKCMNIGFDDYLVKPIERKYLIETIHGYLDYKKVH